MIPALFELGFYVIQLVIWALILDAVFSLLASFRVIDTRNRLVWTIGDALNRVTSPILRPIRNVLPDFGGLDFSPWAAILLLRYVVTPAWAALARGVVSGYWSLM